MCAKTSIAPLDRVKILLQAHNVHYKHLGKCKCIFCEVLLVLKNVTVRRTVCFRDS